MAARIRIDLTAPSRRAEELYETAYGVEPSGRTQRAARLGSAGAYLTRAEQTLQRAQALTSRPPERIPHPEATLFEVSALRHEAQALTAQAKAAEAQRVLAAASAGEPTTKKALRQAQAFGPDEWAAESAAEQAFAQRLRARAEQARRTPRSPEELAVLDVMLLEHASSGRDWLISGPELQLPLRDWMEQAQRVSNDTLLTTSPSHEMRRARGLTEYALELSPAFKADLETLGRDGAWLDIGCGEGLAAREYFARGGQARVVGVDLGELRPDVAAELAGQRFAFERGSVTQLPTEQKFDIVTDVFAAASYDRSLTATLQRSLELLKPGGRFYLRAGDAETRVCLPDRTVLGLCDWLRSIPGLRVEELTERTGGPMTFLLTLEPGVAVKVPDVSLVAEHSFRPPSRVFLAEPGPDHSSH